MSDDIGYTIVVVYGWSIYGEGLKNIFKKYSVKWNSDKMKNLNDEELREIIVKYKVENDISWKSGKTGVWESKECAIKIVLGDEEDGNDVALLIYRKRIVEDKMWSSFVKYCKECGALVQVLDENMEVLFRDRINVELIKGINDDIGEKNIIIENFMKKCDMIGIENIEFKNKWINCIKE